jgi:hypothetical protein
VVSMAATAARSRRRSMVRIVTVMPGCQAP